ncbi:(d)CMP kinase [Methanolobus halotolerans]|uniref:Cytidylate kinase n=1 Tax=Methanolobus halotolerans TaxID=2052935 RepID=A0A4E0QR03_9EURY|nr:AAA family ATPase [Methanolobus halotolerans]TGC08482.1 cytidylate kinase [Methanolobus halotolerans]
MLLTISGLPGSGTTTVSRILAERYRLEMVSAGEVFRSLAREYGMSLAEFGELAESDDSIDLKIDERQRQIANTRDNLILEGRLAGHMAGRALKVWIKAPVEVRVNRIAGRESGLFEEKLDETKEREASEATRYSSIYSIDIRDLSIYDLIVDSSKWDQYMVADIISCAIDTFSEEFCDKI